ncbi:hypothetical protein TWF217_011872 [Orbilia oligospora]|nr:hypothetical protein TWF217_011872 [Orbilia oligospora]
MGKRRTRAEASRFAVFRRGAGSDMRGTETFGRLAWAAVSSRCRLVKSVLGKSNCCFWTSSKTTNIADGNQIGLKSYCIEAITYKFHVRMQSSSRSL